MESDTTLKAPVSIRELSLEQVKVFPNPSTSYFTIEGVSGVTEIRIYDLKGTMQESLFNPENLNVLRINTLEFTNGQYVVEIKCEDHIIRKLISVIR